MRRWLATTAVVLGALGSVSPAAADIPTGQGLVSFGEWSCPGLSDDPVTFIGPRGFKANTVYTAETGDQVILQSLDVTFDSTTGEDFSFSMTFGQKAGFTTTFTCTQQFSDAEGSGESIAVVAVVPPQ
jgi:hypothetical protein